MKKEKLLSILFFITGFVLFMFTRSHRLTPVIPIAIIIAPPFIIRFARGVSSTKKAILLILAGFILSVNIGAWRGFFGSIPFSLLAHTLLAITFSIPYIIDRFAHKRLKGFLSTLVFPSAMTAILFINSLEGLTDGDSILSMYLIAETPLLQLSSLFGLPGLIFFWSWTASLFNQFWENDFSLKSIEKSFITFFSIVILISIFSYIKNPDVAANSDTVKIAALSIVEEISENSEDIFDHLENNKTSNYSETMEKIENLIIKAVLNDAEILVFQEYAFFADDKSEIELLNKLSQIAGSNKVYISFSYVKLNTHKKGENKQLLINKEGQILLNYQKRFPLGLSFAGEAKYISKGPEVIQFADTEYGRIGLAICRDLFSPTYIRQAGRNNVDIILNPAYESNRASNHYYEMRGIEYGFSIVRPSKNGISYARDPNGNVLASMDYYGTRNGIMYADIPTKGIRTLYSIIGDLFAWLAVLFTLSVIVVLIILKRRRS